MKLKNFLAMMAIALCAVACSDNDDKKEDTVIPAQEVCWYLQWNIITLSIRK